MYVQVLFFHTFGLKKNVMLHKGHETSWLTAVSTFRWAAEWTGTVTALPSPAQAGTHIWDVLTALVWLVSLRPRVLWWQSYFSLVNYNKTQSVLRAVTANHQNQMCLDSVLVCVRSVPSLQTQPIRPLKNHEGNKSLSWKEEILRRCIVALRLSAAPSYKHPHP